MRKFIVIILLLSQTILKAQEIPALTLFIKDSIKTIHPLLKNEKTIRMMQYKIFNKKLRFKMTINNNTKYDSIIIYLLNRKAEEASLLPNKKDTIIIINDTSNFRTNIDEYINIVQDKRAVPVFYLTEQDTETVIINTLKKFNSSASVTNDLYWNIQSNFGISYIIEDEKGNVIRGEKRTPHINYTDEGLKKKFYKVEKNNARIIRALKGNLTKGLEKIIIGNAAKNIKIYFYYRRLKKGFLRDRTYFYHNLESGVYYITFFYTFYLNNDFREGYRLSKFQCNKFHPIDAINKDLKDNNIYKRQIFQGFIKSNRVKLIVK